MKPNNLLKPILTIILVLVLVGGFVYFAKSKSSLTNVDNSGVTEKGNLWNVDLESNINAYMEAQVDEEDLGKDNYHCANILFGHDDRYAYAWVYCAGFKVNANGSVEMTSGESLPVRLEYAKPDFKIIAHTLAPEGENNVSVWKEIFPGEFYEKAIKNPSNEEIKKLEQEVRAKVVNIPKTTSNQVKAKPPIVDHFACSDNCPGPQEKYMVKIYQGITDPTECKALGGKPYSYVGWTEVHICIVQ